MMELPSLRQVAFPVKKFAFYTQSFYNYAVGEKDIAAPTTNAESGVVSHYIKKMFLLTFACETSRVKNLAMLLLLT